MQAEHIDFGHKRFVILTAMDCDNTSDTSSRDVVPLSVIDNPSAKFFEYAMLSSLEVDTASDGNNFVDSTETMIDTDGDGVTDTLSGTVMDYDAGWTCRDLAATETNGNAWVKCEGAVNEGYVWCSI